MNYKMNELTETLQVRVSKSTKATLELRARQWQIKLSQLVRMALVEWLRENAVDSTAGVELKGD